MPNAYTQLHIHLIFVVKFRRALIDEKWESRLYQYITGIVQNNGHKMLAINGAYDHVHMFIGLNPKQSISDLMRLVKGDSSEFINQHSFTSQKFNWQGGYGAFSHNHSQIKTVVRYIMNQKEHHNKQSFREEYLQILEDNNVDFESRYLFHDPME